MPAGHDSAAFAADDQHAPVVQFDRGGADAIALHVRAHRGEAARRRIVHFRGVVGDVAARHAAAAAAGDQYFAGAEKRGDVRDARLIQMAGAAESAARRIVDLGRARRLNAVGAAADDQHAPVAKHRRGMSFARRRHRAGRAEGAAARIVNLRAGELRAKAGVLDAAREQHATVAEHRDRLAGPPDGHRAGRREGARGRIVKLGAREHAADFSGRGAAANQHASVAKPNRGGVGARRGHRERFDAVALADS